MTLTTLFTERFCWKFCKVKLLWEVPVSSFSQPGCKCHTSCGDFACLPSPNGSHHRDQTWQREGKDKGGMAILPCSLPSLIQQIQRDPPKCSHKAIYHSCQPQRGRAPWAWLNSCSHTPVQTASVGRAPATALSCCWSGQIYHLGLYVFCHKGDSFP